MKNIAEQEVIDIGDMDVEAFNDFAAEQGWSDGMPLYVPTEAKVAKFVETVRGDNRPIPPVPPRQVVPTMQSMAANAVMAGCKSADLRLPPSDTLNWYQSSEIVQLGSCSHYGGILFRSDGRSTLGI